MHELRNTLDQRRNRNFAETHRQLIERAVVLVGKDGVEALSVATLARDAGMNRSTVYYHFESRDALLTAVKQWVSSRLSDTLLGSGDIAARTRSAINFALGHADVMQLWAMDLIEDGAIRDRFPYWDMLVGVVQRGLGLLAGQNPRAATPPDAEVVLTALIGAALMGSRVYKGSVRPDDSAEDVARSFSQVLDWVLGQLKAGSEGHGERSGANVYLR